MFRETASNASNWFKLLKHTVKVDKNTLSWGVKLLQWTRNLKLRYLRSLQDLKRKYVATSWWLKKWASRTAFLLSKIQVARLLDEVSVDNRWSYIRVWGVNRLINWNQVLLGYPHFFSFSIQLSLYAGKQNKTNPKPSLVNLYQVIANIGNATWTKTPAEIKYESDWMYKHLSKISYWFGE